MGEPREAVIRLADGRRLGYAEFGAPQGIPVIYHHGFPACRLEAGLVDHHAARLGLRLIAIDRPGFGLSEFLPGRTLLDLPDDVGQLASQLGIQRFAVLGVSGGAPAALACAALLPERISAVSIVCGLGPVAEPELLRAMRWPARYSYGLTGQSPGFAGILFGRIIGPLLGAFPGLTLALLNVAAPAEDAAVLRDRDVRRLLAETVREAFRQGGAGPARELAIAAAPWPFDLARIEPSVHFWHGGRDATVPCSHTSHVAALIPRATTHLLPGEGHFSLPILHAESILGNLLERHLERKDG